MYTITMYTYLHPASRQKVHNGRHFYDTALGSISQPRVGGKVQSNDTWSNDISYKDNSHGGNVAELVKVPTLQSNFNVLLFKEN